MLGCVAHASWPGQVFGFVPPAISRITEDVGDLQVIADPSGKEVVTELQAGGNLCCVWNPHTPEIDCIVDDVDDTEAMIDTLNANIHGSHNPYKEAKIFKQINERYALKDIEKLTIYGQSEIKDRMELLNLSPSIQAQIEQMEKSEAKEAPVVLTFMVKESEKGLVESALATVGDGADRNKAFLELCKKFASEVEVDNGEEEIEKQDEQGNEQGE